MSSAGWAIYGVPLAILCLIAPWILARKGLKVYLSLALVGWLYAWLAATFLDTTSYYLPAEGQPPLGLIDLAIARLSNNVLEQLIVAIAYGLPVWGAVFTIWLLSKIQASLLFQSIGGILVGAALCVGAAVVSMMMLFLFFA
jgi:hypothetical protein